MRVVGDAWVLWWWSAGLETGLGRRSRHAWLVRRCWGSSGLTGVCCSRGVLVAVGGVLVAVAANCLEILQQSCNKSLGRGGTRQKLPRMTRTDRQTDRLLPRFNKFTHKDINH